MSEEYYNPYSSNQASAQPQKTDNSNQKKEADRVGIGSWIFTIIILTIPIINIIYYVCLLIGLGLQPKVALARAILTLTIIGFVISFVILCIMAGSVDAVIEIYKQFFLTWIELFKSIRS